MTPLLAQTESPIDLSEVVEGSLTAVDWITAGAVLVGTVVLARIAHSLVRRTLRRVGAMGPLGDAVSRLVQYVVILVGLFYALSSLGVRVGPLLGMLGLGGLVLALAVQGTLENIVAGFMLQARREFGRGDQIRTQDHTGTVEEINARAVVLRALSGERVIVPNAAVLNNPLMVLTAEAHRRSTMVVGVEYRTDLVRARTVLLDAVRGTQGVVTPPAPDVEITEFGESSINFAVRFWHGSLDAERFAVTGRVAIAVKAALDAAGITIAFPQRVLWPAEPFPIAEPRRAASE